MKFSRLAVSVTVWALSASRSRRHGIQVSHCARHGVLFGHGADHVKARSFTWSCGLSFEALMRSVNAKR